MSKVGILGATFDPIHNAHIMMARCAMEQKNLDKVLFMPSKIPPHKKNREITDEAIRSELVKLAICSEENFVFSDFELKRKEVTYTAKTVTLLNELYPNDSFYFILGGDSLFQFESWYHPEVILEKTAILAVCRGQFKKISMKRQAAYLSEKYHGIIELIDMEQQDISSSMIRQKMRNKESIREYVPQEVADYLEKNKIYQDGKKE